MATQRCAAVVVELFGIRFGLGLGGSGERAGQGADGAGRMMGSSDDVREGSEGQAFASGYESLTSAHEPRTASAGRSEAEAAEKERHLLAQELAQEARFSPGSIPVASVVDEGSRVGAGADGQQRFKFDSSKPFYLFGKGTVDKSGASGGPAWIPDAACAACTTCRKEFTMFFRRHHCRRCGKIFCGNCANEFRLLPVEFGVREPQRVCKDCCAELEPLQSDLAATISNSTRSLGAKDSKNTFFSNPVSFSLTAEIQKAIHTVDGFFDGKIQDRYIPAQFLQSAKGLCFLTVVKGGFLFSARIGTGLVVGRDRQGSWTAPSAIGLAGVGWGAQIGGEVTTFMIILNTEAAVDAFSGKGQVSIGSQIAVAAGPLGRTGEASVSLGDGGMAPCYSYSQSKGFFVGLSLEGAIITERKDVNKNFYGVSHDPKDILAGRVARPQAAAGLYDALRRAEDSIGEALAAAAVPATAYESSAGTIEEGVPGGGYNL